MKIIKLLSERIESELEDGEFYAKSAVLYREEHPEIARAFYEISLEEMRHVDILHGKVTEMIEKHKREKGDPPADMLAIWRYVHERNIEWANEIKNYQNQYLK